MAIDTSIYSRIQAPQIESPLEAQAKVMQFQGVQRQNKLAELALGAKEREIEQENALSQLYKSAVGADGAIDRTKLLQGAAQGGLGAKIPTLQKTFADQDKSTRDAEKAQLESQLKKFEVAGQIMAGVTDQATWERARQQTAQVFGPEAAAQMPAQYDPALIEQKRLQAMSVKEQLENQWKAKRFDLDTQKFAHEKQTDAQQLAISRGNLGVAQANLGLRRQEVAQGSKAPAGYRWKADGSGMEAIPGGPADIKAGELGAKREKQQQASIAQADRVISKVDQSLNKVSWWSAGKGSILAGVPGTDAKNLQSDLETIKANLGFAELQAMRDASPTGGALGAIAVQELTALQSTVSSLDQAQSPSQLKARLGEIKKHYENWKKAVEDANGGSSSPNVDDLLKKYGG